MKPLICLSILLCQLILVASKAINSNTSNTKELELQIQALEEEKDVIFEKLNVAINESILALERVNDSDSDNGRQYLMKLRKQIEEINDADSMEESDEKNVTSLENSVNGLNAKDIEFRRKGKRNKNHSTEEVSDEKGTVRALSQKIIKIKKKNKKELPFLHSPQHLKVENELRDWIAKKRQEERKIEEYRLKIKAQDGNFEVCPRHGDKKKKTSKKQKKKGKKNRNHIRPCCRKCCKKSYLGCL